MPRSRSVRDHVAHLLLRVVLAVGAHLLQLGIPLALDAEALVFAEVPVEDVHLHRGHAVDVALDHVDRLEVAAHVDHQAAPGEARLVLNVDERKVVAAASPATSCERVSMPRIAPTAVLA